MDAAALAAAVDQLASCDRVFAELRDRNGTPPLWRRPASFTTLVRLILEQQVSLASANAAYRRLEARVGVVTPDAVLASTADELRADGFSRQKAGYVRGIATAIVSGEFTPEALVGVDDAADRLLALKGVGPWTVACFEIFALGVPDAWPTGDRAVYVSMSQVFDLDDVPDRETADAMASEWSPHRATAARMLWHDYLGGRSYTPSPDAGFLP